MKEKTRHLQSLLLSLMMLIMGAAGAWATGYTPSADEVIILKDVYSSTATTAGYSTHAAIAWGGTASTSNKIAGDPNNGGNATSSDVETYSVKGNGGGKIITVSVTGVSKIIIYHEKHSERYVELRSGSKSGTLIGKGSKGTYYTEIDLDGNTDYSGDAVIFLHGAQSGSSDDQDIYVYAIKLVKAGAPTTYTVTFDANGHGTGGTAITEASGGAGVTPPTITPTSGYTLSGTWHTAAACTSANKVTLSGGKYYPTANTTLYAGYRFKVTFDATTNGGSCATSNLTQGSAGATITLPAATKAGNTFTGWYTESSGGTRRGGTGDSYTPSDNETLFAQFSSDTNTPFDLSTSPVIDFSESKWTTSAATTAFATTNAGNGTNVPINDVVFRGQTNSEGHKAFAISDGALVMDAGNYQQANRWFAIPVTNINGRIDVYIKAPYGKGSTFTVKAALAGGTTTVVADGSNAPSASPVKMDYVADHFGSGEDAFHFRIKDLKVTTGVLYIGRNGSSYTDINKIKLVSETFNYSVSPTDVTVGDDGTQTVTVTNNSVYSALIDATNLDTDRATYSYDGSTTITFAGVSAGNAGSVKVYLDLNGNGSYDSATESEYAQDVRVTVGGLSWSTNINTTPLRYTTRGESASTLTVAATGVSSPSYQWYKNSKASTAGATAIDGATSASYTPSTDFDEDLSYYFCVASKDGYNSITSAIKPVLTTVSKRTFWMNTITRRSTTSETELALTNGEDVNIAGGSATFKSDGGNSDYVYVYDDAFFQVNGAGKYYKITLGQQLAAGMNITIGINGLAGNQGGVWLSKESTRDAAESSKVEFVGNGTESATTKQYTVKAGDAIVGASTLYVWSKRNSNDYFGPLYITEALPLTVSAPLPATQTVKKNEAATAITVSASGGVPDYHYQWYQDTSATGSFTTPAVGTGNNTASFTPSTASEGTLYYRCTVTDSDSPTPTVVNSSSVSVEVKASVDYYKIGTGAGEDAAFTDDGKYTFETTKFKYNAQTEASRNYWTIESRSGVVDDDCYDGEKSGFNLFMRSSSKTIGVKSTTLYVKGAKAFKIITNDSGDGRTYRLTIDGVVVGNETRESTEESAIMHTLNNEGSIITIDNANSDIRIKKIIFYELIPTTLNIQKNGAEITEDVVYVDNAAPTFNYDVYTDGDGTIGATPTIENPDGKTVVSNASYDNGVLTITKGSDNGTATITLTQDETTTHKGATATLRFTLKKHKIDISVSSQIVKLKASECGAADATIASSKLPVFTVTKDGEPYTPGATEMKFVSDDNSVAYLNNAGDYSNSHVVYRGTEQGGPKILAYIDDTDVQEGDTCSYYLQIEEGTSNPLPKEPDPAISVQGSYPMDDNNGVEVITLTYGGYKYNDNKLGSKQKDEWSAPKADYDPIDGYSLYTWNGKNDAMNEEETTISITPTNSQWYQAGESKPNGGNYVANERLKPFSMPCAGSYLKFEAKKTGKLTVYVNQNGIIGKSGADGHLATNPRVGYWFDQDGWRIEPDAVVSKNVLKKKIGEHYCGRDKENYTTTEGSYSSLQTWNSNPSYQALVKMLTSHYCKKQNLPLDKSTQTQDADDYSDTKDETFKYDNPYYWMTQSEITENIAKKVPTKVRPLPFNGGYLMINAGYAKYSLSVVAGKTYYFFGSGTKIGYVGMNFVEDTETTPGQYDGTYSGSNDIRHESLLELDQTGVFTAPEHPTVYDEATLNRTFKKNTWNTITLPFAVSEKQVEEVFGYGTKLSLYNGLRQNNEGQDFYTVRFINHVDQNILPGQPYFIKPTGVDKNGNNLASVADDKIGGASGGISFNTVMVDTRSLNLTSTETYGDDADVKPNGTTLEGKTRYKFTPTLRVMDDGAGHDAKAVQYSLYMDNGGIVRKASAPVVVAAYRAYLKPNDNSIDYSQMSLGDVEFEDVASLIDGDEEPTMIISINEDNKAEIINSKLFDGKAYNIMGQEVDVTTTKGLVIVNGKKYYR